MKEWFKFTRYTIEHNKAINKVYDQALLCYKSNKGLTYEMDTISARIKVRLHDFSKIFLRIFFHQSNKLVKKIGRIMRAGRSFRVILNGEDRKPSVTHPFQALVVKVDMGNFHLVRRKRIHVHAETMVLSGDLNFAVEQIFYGLIGPAMAEFQLVGLSSHGKP